MINQFKKIIQLLYKSLIDNIIGEYLIIIILSASLTYHFIFLSLNDVLNQSDTHTAMYLSWYVYDSFSKGNIFNLADFYKTNQFYPFSFNLAQDEFALFPSLALYAPVMFFTNNHLLAIKLLILASFILTFIFTYYSIKIIVINKGISIIGSFIYTFSPPAISRFFSGHLEYLYKFFIPITILSFIVFIRQPNLKRSITFFIFFGLNILSNLQLSLFLSILLSFYFIIHFIFEYSKFKNAIQYIVNIIKLSFFGLLLLTPIIYLYSPYLLFSNLERYKVPFNVAAENSSHFIDLLMGIPQNIIFGKLYSWQYSFRTPREINGGFNITEHSYFIGLIPIILVIFFIVRLKIFWKLNKNNIYLLFTAFLGLILSLGPYYPNTNFKLPYYYLSKYIPFLGISRTPGRINTLVILILSYIAIISLNYINNIIDRKYRKYFIIIIFILTFLEFQNFPNKNILSANFKINYELSGKKVLFLPFESGKNYGFAANYLNLIPYNKFTMVNGSTGIETEGYRKLKSQIESYYLTKKWENVIAGLQLDYIILDKNLLSVTNDNFDWSKIADIYSERIVYSDDHWTIFNIKNKQDEECYENNYNGLTYRLISISENKSTNEFDIKVLVTNTSKCHKRLFFRRNYLPIKYILNFVETKNILFSNLVQRYIFFLKLSPIILMDEESEYTFSIPTRFFILYEIKNLEIIPAFRT